METILTINLEIGLPTGDVAVGQMRAALRSAKSQKITVLKLIHGYGSSGKGGVIRTRVRTELTKLQKDGQVRAFIKGEDFSPFDEGARMALAICPQLSRDRDYTRYNHGITIVIL